MDLLNWVASPIRFPLNLSFVFVVYFICVHLRGASFGTRTELGHGPIIVLEMARVRQNGESSLMNSEISNQILSTEG